SQLPEHLPQTRPQPLGSNPNGRDRPAFHPLNTAPRPIRPEQLPKFDPVAVLIYGNADFMEVPWETIIKECRKKLGRHGFAHLEDYADHLLRFLAANRPFFPAAQQKKYFSMAVSAFFRRINADIQEHVRKHL